MSAKNKEKKAAKSSRKLAVFGAALTCVSLFFLADHYLNRDFGVSYVQGLEDRWADMLFRNFAVKGADPRINIIALDDDTVAELGWPFQRRYHAELVRKLKKAGAKTIVFDVMFFDRDIRSARQDEELVRATREAGNVIHLFAIENKEMVGAGGTTMVYHVPQPFEGLGAAAQYVAYPNVDRTLDGDGHIRRIMLFDKRHTYSGGKDDGVLGRGNQGLPSASLDAAAYAGYTGKSLKEVYEKFEEPHVCWLNIRVQKDYVKHPGWMRSKSEAVHTKQSTYRYISAMDVIKGKLSEGEKKAINGGLVLIGSTVIGLFDHYPSPFEKTNPGVEFHANSIDNLLNDDYLRFGGFFISLIVLLVSLWMPIYLRRYGAAAGPLASGALLAAWIAYNAYMFREGIRLSFVVPSLTLVVSFLVVTVYRAVTEGREKKWIKNTFGQYLSPKVVEVITKDPSKLRLGGEKRDMTVFFLDIAHFTTISEKMDPEKLTVFLNKYLSVLTDVILKNEGVVDKYIGDCIMAFWNAPLDLKEHRLSGCLSAIECIAALEKLNKELTDLPEKPAVRIGLNSGNMVVGNMGSNTRFSYTVIGDEVNLASRLEGANKFFGSRIMASESTYSGASDKLDARLLGRVRVVGKAIPIKVFELLGRKGKLAPETEKLLSDYSEGLELFYKRQFEKAGKAFKSVLESVPNDAPTQLYLRISQDYAVIPPPKEWDGVFNLTAK